MSGVKVNMFWKLVEWLMFGFSAAYGIFALGVMGTRANAWWGFLLGAAVVALPSLMGAAFALHGRRGFAAIVLALGGAAHPVYGVFIAISRGESWMELWNEPMGFVLVMTFVLLTHLLPAYFWWKTRLRGWPDLWGRRDRFHRYLVYAGAGGCAFILANVVSVVVAVHTPRLGDCGGGAPPHFGYADYPHSLTVVRFVRNSTLWGGVGVVEEDFRKYFLLNRRYLLLNERVPVGQTYFFDGHPAWGFVPRLWGVIQIHDCGRTRLARNAALDLRVQRDGPQPGVRLIGEVVQRRRGQTDEPRIPVAGIPILIEGAHGSVTVFSDENGIYDLKGQPDGEYRIRYAGQDSTQADASCATIYAESKQLRSGDIWGCSFTLSR